MRRHLLWANSLEQVLHVVHIRHVNWGAIGVVWMHVASLHVCQPVLVVVVGAVLGLVLWLNSR